MKSLTGTLTFLFTDVEGSTRLWEQHPDAMQHALRRHDELLRAAIEDHRGRVFKTVGDAFCAVFRSAPDALEAAVAAQRALAAEVWPPAIGSLRSRMGLHTGAAEERDHDYFGPALNRVARLEAAAHGGQIVLSVATHELVRDAVAKDVALSELGTYRLKDILRPERIFQATAAGLPASFPPLRTLDTRRSNLPTGRTPFLGREREIAAVVSLLRRPDVRLVTLTGPGGTGKTRLSIQAASALADEFRDGVWFVELETVREREGLVAAIGAVFGVKADGSDALAALIRALAEKETLLVLDNFEQLVGSAGVIGEILEACPGVTAVASSRERLRLYGEHDYPVPPLGLPEQPHRQTAAVIAEYEAVRLFTQRAKMAQPAFTITEQNAQAVADICRRLDGLPLAIELAAARVRMLAPGKILERLDNRLQTLTGGARDLPARQQTIRGAIAWSYDLLEDSEKRLFCSLGTFSGDWTLDAAENVAPADVDVLTGLESLMDKSLVREQLGSGGEPRFGMLETIHEFAREQLTEQGELNDTATRHASYFTAFAERYGYTVEEERDSVELYPLLAAELDNFRAALRWTEASQNRELALRMTSALWQMWQQTGNDNEAVRLVQQALRLPGQAPKLVEANAHRTAANLLLNGTGEQAALCRTYYARALKIYREIDHPLGALACVMNLGVLLRENGDLERAARHFAHGFRTARTLKSSGVMRLSLLNLGATLADLGRAEPAITAMTKAVELARRRDSRGGLAHALYLTASVLTSLGRLDEAERMARESFDLLLEDGVSRAAASPVVYTLLLYARLAVSRGDHERAAILLGFMETVVPIPDINFDRQHVDFYEQTCEAVRT
ncbi:MAG: ATP-binding protein, partial [Spirochaetota bacterium]